MESGGKIWTCLLKLHSTCPKEHFEKEQLLKVLIFFKLFRFLNEDSPCLAKKFFGRDIKIENCSLRLKRSIKKPNFWKFSFFSNSSELWTNNYRAWRKSFGQGHQNWKLYFLSSEYPVGDKNNFRKFCNVSFYSDLEYISFGFEATEFSPSLSKIQSTCLYEFSLRCWY